MAVLYISEFNRVGSQVGNVVPVAEQPSLADQAVAIGVAAQSNAFQSGTKYVLLSADAVCSVLFGTNPTAATTNMRIPANTPMYFHVPPGQSFKVSVISNT
jgi:hypothetical protein